MPKYCYGYYVSFLGASIEHAHRIGICVTHRTEAVVFHVEDTISGHELRGFFTVPAN